MIGTVSKYDTPKGERWRWAWTEYFGGEQLPRKTQHSGKGLLRKGDADEALRKSLLEYDRGHRTNPELGLTVREYLPVWLAGREGLEPSTRRSYEITVERINLVLGDTVLRKLSKADVNRLKSELRKPGANRRTGVRKGLSDATIGRTLVILSSALGAAVADGHLPRNPCEGVERPQAKAPNPVSWSAAELGAFLGHRLAAKDRLYPLWHLTANTGMRRSELLGLRWESVDFEKGSLVAWERSVMVGSQMIWGSGGKTDNAPRTIKLDAGTVEVLKRWKETQSFEAMVVGSTYRTDLVFTGVKGGPLHGDRVGDAWTQAVRESGVKTLMFKGLRSTHCSILIGNGVPVKVVSKRLGHGSEAFTMRVYQALLPGSDEGAADLFSRLIEESALSLPAPEENAG